MLIDYRVGGVQKGQNIDYVIYEWSLSKPASMNRGRAHSHAFAHLIYLAHRTRLSLLLRLLPLFLKSQLLN